MLGVSQGRAGLPVPDLAGRAAGLPAGWLGVLQTIVAGPVAWTAEAALEAPGATLAAMAGAAWIERWDRPEGPAWTLTTTAATRLGVELAEAPADRRLFEAPAWVAKGFRARGVRAYPHPRKTAGGEAIARMVAPRSRSDPHWLARERAIERRILATPLLLRATASEVPRRPRPTGRRCAPIQP